MKSFKTWIRFKNMYRKILTRKNAFPLFVLVTSLFLKFILYQFLSIWLSFLVFRMIYFHSILMFYTEILIFSYIIIFIMVGRRVKMNATSKRKFYNYNLALWDKAVMQKSESILEESRHLFPPDPKFDRMFHESFHAQDQRNRELYIIKMKVFVFILGNFYCFVITFIIIILLHYFTVIFGIYLFTLIIIKIIKYIYQNK